MNSFAYEHNGRSCTREQFYAVACDPQRSVVVEACAGAGKTWMLVSRILRALLDEAEPQDILAITFTKKAAGEMRQRLQEWLDDFAAPRPATDEKAAETEAEWQQRLLAELQNRGLGAQGALQRRERLQVMRQALLVHGRPVQIRTFHSWFIALLAGAPLSLLQELGLPGQYELIEDEADAVAEAWRPFLRRVQADEGLRADYVQLLASHGRHSVHQALQTALRRRTEFGLMDQGGGLEQAVPAFDAVFKNMASVQEPRDWLLQRAAGRELLQQVADILAQGTPSVAAQAEVLRAALAGSDWGQLQQALLTGKGEPRKFSDKLAGIDTVRAAQDELLQIQAAEQQQQAHLYHQRMTRLTRVFIDCFAALKRERGWVDMADVERAAMRLLGQHELSAWVQQRLDARVRHLLIDEFQDTNPLQWQALHAWLSAYAGAGGGPETPRVFIVGDPKQSIYRFRGADPQVFVSAQDFVVQALGGDRLACDHTHRNAPVLIEGLNQVMAQAAEQGEFDGFRAHTTESVQVGQIQALPLVPRPPREKASSQKDDPDALDWRDSLSAPRTEVEETLRNQSCRQAAHWIARRLQGGGLKPQDIMVLARTRQPLGVLQAELRQLGIACEQPEEQRLADLPAVKDLLALVEALLSPGHDLALARALKSSLFGLSDTDLSQLALAVRAQDESRPSWLQTLPTVAGLSQDGAAVHAQLMQYRQWLLQLPPHDALQAIYRRGDVLARYAACVPASERAHVLSQLRALLGAALNVQGGRFLTAGRWLRALRRQRILAPRQAAPDAVQLLTVHGAKGLEAEVVLLLDAAVSTQRNRGEPITLVDWPGHASAPTALAFVARSSAPPPSLQDLMAAEQQAQAREEMNALYVAITRARSQLVLAGFEPYHKPPDSWWQRLEAQVQTWLPAEDLDTARAAQGEQTAPGDFMLPELPAMPLADDASPMPDAPPAPWMDDGPDLPEPEDDDASRLGQAMHWLLEHAGDTPDGWRPQRVAQAQRRFALDAGQSARAEQLARNILHGEAAWAWDAEQLLDAFDEVELVHQGQRLRIDRLVRRRATADEPECWWVLDYKSAAHPERDASLQAQLQRYRDAVEQLHQGQEVRVAFVSGEGRVA